MKKKIAVVSLLALGVIASITGSAFASSVDGLTDRTTPIIKFIPPDPYTPVIRVVPPDPYLPIVVPPDPYIPVIGFVPPDPYRF